MNLYQQAIARSAVKGARGFSSSGNLTLGGLASGVLWPPGTVFNFPSPAGVQMTVASTSASDSAAGTGIRTIAIHYLDTDLNPQVETVILNGISNVLTVATNIRFIQCVHLITAGTNKSAVGDISVKNSGITYALIPIGDERCRSSVRMVPKGKKLVVSCIFAASASGPAQTTAIIEFAATKIFDYDLTPQGIFMPQITMVCQDDSASTVVECPDFVYPEGIAVGMTYSVDKAATVSGQWFGYLEDA